MTAPPPAPDPGRSSRARPLLAAVGLQLLLAAGLVTPALLANLDAQEVLLQTQPVDPRDPLRGHYLTLGYAFNTLKTAQTFETGQPVYLPLHPGTDGVWTGDTLQASPPTEGIFLRGRVAYHLQGQTAVNYGIERFYLEETAALDQERLGWDGQAKPLRARVRVGRGGQARVVGLERGGVVIE
ncbi:GDYXXLXY domain-containing protein [Deinococcus radiophilus]|uniref:GDYXXLXY domain-containing protein n=1 Tax=Deinococcus radiophilus TaxID=32062 RepID=A0A3S0KFJ6_9DEIO|nr:GDYXXLXY domain-containing protein [Deinococcus radiophilus]RTR29411.1 hypothetical protein EJ104_03200 [Deinococcus radiophilus]UFA50761.1 GDYXXLXY domain-containing protein [Deinococcus radiophilus]